MKNNTSDLTYLECLATKSICVRKYVRDPDKCLTHKLIFPYILGLATLPGISPVASELMF